MDAAVAGGEGARSEAVGRYQAAASELAESRARIQRLRTGVHFVSPRGESHDEAANRETASSSANDFFNSTADQLETSVAFVTGEVPHSLGTQAEAAKGAIAASIDTEKAAITRSMEAARRRARTDAAIARRAVTGQAAAMVRAISTGAAAALRILSLARTTAAGRIDTLETTGLGQINNIYSEGRATLAALGPTVGDECIAVGSRFASQYRGFANCRENSFWDGDLSGRRAAAQANAANETAQSYKDGIVQSARDRAREITRNGRKDDRCAVLASAAESRHTLQTQYDGLTQAIETARSAAVRQAESARDGLLASINRQLADAIRRLNAQEHDQRQAADDTGYIQQVMQEQLAHSGVAALQQSVISAVTAATQALESLRSRFGENHPPDNEALNVALTQARSNVGAATRGLQSRLEQGNSQSSSQMTQAGSDGLAAVTGVATSAAEAAGQSADGFHSTMNGIGETDNFAEQRTGFQNTMQQAGTGGGTALAQVATGMEQSNTRIAQAARASLSRAGRELETSLRNQKHGLECEITTKATEAASKEAPAWKRVLAVVLVIIVIIIVIAVIILTAGMALGPLATIAVGVLIGAAVGAVTSGLLAVAGNLWGNRSWSRGVGDAMIQGAIVGAIGGGLGAGVGLIFKSATITVQMVSQMVAAGLVDTVTQLYNSHWSFENFSFLQLGFTLVVTALSFGFANKVAAGRVGFANRIRAMAGLKNLAPPPPPVSANATMVGNTNTPAFRNLPADRLPANLPAGHSWSRNAAGDWIIVRAPGAPAANLEVHVYADASGNINLTMSENGRLVFSDAMTRPTGNTYSANKRYPLELRPAGDRNPYYENLPGGGNRMWNKAHGIDYADTLEGPGVMDSNLDPMNYTPGDPVVNQQIKNQQVADARRNGGGYREFAEYGSTPRSVRGSHRTPARQIPDSYLFIETNRSGVPIRAWRTANVIGGTPTPVPLNQVPRAVLTATPAPPPPPGTPLIPYVVYGHPGDDEGRQPSGTQSAQPASDAR